MFNRIEIERFWGIHHASIDGFRQINLFFGKNNCGKSSLLESLFLVSRLSNPLLTIHVNFMRGYSKVRFDDLKLDFYNLDYSQPIHIRMENEEKRDLKISFIEQNQNTISLNADEANLLSNVEEGKYGLKFDFMIDGKPFEAQINFDSSDSQNITRNVLMIM